MKTDDLLKDPVFQLNLLLWMAKEQPLTGYRVRPLFCEWGFRIIYIEQPFPFPEETAMAIAGSGLDITSRPEPEAILGRTRDNRALYFEAKANSFGPTSPNCRQARGHLLASGPAFGEVLAPLDSCLLCYVVPNAACGPMSACLAALADELKGKGLNPGPFSTHGLAVNGSELVYSWDSAFKSHVGAKEDATSVLDDLSEETDPTPLVLVFSDEDCGNPDMRDFYRRAVVEQARACLLCDLHSLAIGSKYETTPDGLLAKMTDEIFQYLGRQRQKGLRRLITENVFKRIHEDWRGKQPGIGLEGDRLTVTWSVPGEKEDFLNWLEDRRKGFSANRPPDDSQPLFDHLGQPNPQR